MLMCVYVCICAFNMCMHMLKWDTVSYTIDALAKFCPYIFICFYSNYVVPGQTISHTRLVSQMVKGLHYVPFCPVWPQCHKTYILSVPST